MKENPLKTLWSIESIIFLLLGGVMTGFSFVKSWSKLSESLAALTVGTNGGSTWSNKKKKESKTESD